ALALWASISELSDPSTAIFGGAATSDGLGHVLSATISLALLLSCLVSFGYLEALNATRGEFYALALFAGAGMCILAQATDLVVIFIALEVMSLSVYCLTAYLRRKRPVEAAFKYFVLGSLASAFYLYGAALAFGATGSTRLADLTTAVHSMNGTNTGLLLTAAAMLAAGFAFKVAAVPFHMWLPDVYEGAPAPVTGFMAAGVKAAAFATLARILVSGYGDASAALGPNGWQHVIEVLAGLTMLIGNVLAVPQRSVKRMLAYSSIAHAGYLLVAVASMAGGAPRAEAAMGLSFYLTSYAVTVVGAFGVVALIERKLALADKSDDLTNWAGLAEKHPLLAAAMALFMVSLAGIPPTAGFMAKLTVFRSAISAGLTGLAVFGVLTSAAGLYYYLRVIVYLYMHPAEDKEPVVGGKLLTAGLALAGCAALVMWMGLQPGAFTTLTQNALANFGR
ncbi:MAG: NADH-quinone oxidoreductase subunit N, partial [Deltaproteobacteria bacterium]|nr:NADH-quinone oxidoreductase subunit N [Deltaproteobacteria bacterium]